MSITGTKIIKNVGQKGQVLDANEDFQIIGNKEDPKATNQHWTITTGKQSNTFLIHNKALGGFLWHDGPGKRLKLSIQEMPWVIQLEPQNKYKIQAFGIGSVLSLKSSEPNYLVVLDNFYNANEEWVFEDVNASAEDGQDV